MNAIVVDLTPWRESCATYVTEAIYVRYTKELHCFGERGRQSCRQDILSHIDYLQGALIGNEPSIFTQYALWLKDVLSSRGVSSAHLATSFDFLKAFFNSNIPAAEASAVAKVLGAARSALSLDEFPVIYGQNRYPEHPMTDQYGLSILQGRHNAAMSLMTEAMNNGSSLTQASVHLVQPALYQVGNLWQNNQITVSQEHLATAISQNVLARAYLQASFAPSVGKTAMFACVEGNHHSVGLQILADGFETEGWDVLNMGANLPMKDLVHNVDTKRPDLLALSISLPNHITTARLTIEMLHAEMGSACPEVWVGGLASVSYPQIWRITKADGWSADALHALEQL